jgi:peptidoglycan/LPS O-acetylase OafA/YrhL
MNSKRLEKLEAIRGFAAIYVVLFHVLPQEILLFGVNIGYLFRFGPEAVILFFVLSGFVIQYSFQRSANKSFRHFLFKRFIRLYIPLLFVFLLGYILKSYSQGKFADPDWPTLLGNIFMLQDVISQKPNVICATYMGNSVLWSLSYEWWFYMIFYFIQNKIKPKSLHICVSLIVVTATISYLIYPFFLNRVVMYFAIWWIGVTLVNTQLKGETYTLKSILPFSYVLIVIILILGLNLYLNFSYTKVYSYPLVAYPFVELRHFTAAFLIMFGAIIWNSLKWIGFNTFFGLFKYLAPGSYVIYISHHYLVVKATYLDFIGNRILEVGIYIVLMILFSYLLEVIVYEKLKKVLLGSVVKSKIKYNLSW